ncbi:hypothetical protein HPP92_006639 [Vanilla planifolia]|uniref:BHLH domain-containing protein n=1 Tax=Vanilla planifolia TaxID=51239 RepID=A0A835RCE4_VANPL|nr:hypothetical protein HPP92_006639 [Vanilla planifolia]
MATNLIDLCDLYPIPVHPLETFGYDEVIEDGLLPSSFNICPQLLFHSNEPFLQEGLCQRDGKESFFSEEVVWDAISSDPFYDCLTKYIETTQVDDQFIASFKDKDVNMIPNISNCLVPNGAITSDIDMEGFYHNYPALGEELEVVMLSENDSKSLACPIDFDIYEGILRSSMLELHDNELIDDQLEVEVLETVGSSLKKHGVVLEESGNNDLIGEVVYTPVDDDPGRPGYAFSCHNFSAKCPDSCRTQCEVRGLLGSEYSINKNKRISSLHSNSEDHTSDPDAWPSNFVSMPPSNEYQMDDADEHLKNFFEKSQRSKRKAEKRERKGRRPRDRQLIQDRIKELRELIPNGTQCSIDELLERTVKHMMFLQSIAVRAEKLNQSIRSKVVYDLCEGCFLIKIDRDNFSNCLNIIIVIITAPKISFNYVMLYGSMLAFETSHN